MMYELTKAHDFCINRRYNAIIIIAIVVKSSLQV